MRRAVSSFVVVALATTGCGGDEPPATTTTSEATTSTSTSTTEAAPAEATTTTTAAGGLHGFVPTPLAWSSCGGGIECATLAVPLDWEDVDGTTIDLALQRVPAAGGAGEYLGSLAYNLGGPGAETLDSLVPGRWGPTIGDHFDVLAWDVRGVGRSTPLACGDAVDPFLRLDSSPDDAAEQQALDAGAQAVSEECGAEDAELLPHVGTDDVARDLEAIRLASGVPLSYLGFSYGTFIGLRYLDLFPTSPARVVLDGVVDPDQPLTELLRGQTLGFERTTASVFAACPDRGTFNGVRCPDGGAAAAYDRVASAVEAEPLRAGGDVLGPSDLATALAGATYSQSRWAQLFAGLRAAEANGDGTQLLSLARTYRAFGSFVAYYAVSCLDSEQPDGPAEWAAFAAELAAISPRVGLAVANEMLPCATWPAEPRPATGDVVAEGSPPVLVIGTTGDAATPIENAEEVAADLADGHLLVFEGEGHTAFSSSTCVQRAVVDYLVAGTLPAEGARC